MYFPKSSSTSHHQLLITRQPALARWYEQLQGVITDHQNPDNLFSESNWRLLGHGLVIEGEDKDAYLNFLNWVCTSLDVELLCVRSEEFADLKDHLSKQERPVIVYIEPGEWFDGDEVSDDIVQLRRELHDLLDWIAQKPIVFTSTWPSYGAIADEFRCRDKFDRHITWASPQPIGYAQDFIEMVGPEYLSDDLIASPWRLGNLLCVEFPNFRRLGMLAITVQRKSQAHSRKVDWRDILEIAVHGTGDGTYGHPAIDLRQIAAHEAGHAVLAIIESGGEHMPDWVSILPGKDMIGVMVEDYTATYKAGGVLSFATVRSSIRISLAGRVAEELILGELNVGASCANDDLREATWKAVNLMSRNGFSPNYGAGSNQGDNMLVVYKNYVSADSDHFHDQARAFIKEQYQIVKKTLQNNVLLLRSIQEALLRDRLLLREDLVKLANHLNIDHRLAA
jgi:hypothetical protein